jgi:hypothetical protein
VYRLDIHQFFSTMGDKLGSILGFNPVLENIVLMKTAILLIAVSLLISSLALLVLAISHKRLRESKSLSKPNPCVIAPLSRKTQ